MAKKIIADIFLWVLVSIIFGLLKLWISISFNFFNQLEISFDKYILSGILLFYCSGIVISSSFDVWMNDNLKMDKRLYIIFHIINPNDFNFINRNNIFKHFWKKYVKPRDKIFSDHFINLFVNIFIWK